MLTSAQVRERFDIKETSIGVLAANGFFRNIKAGSGKRYRFDAIDSGAAHVANRLVYCLGLSTDVARGVVKAMASKDLMEVAQKPENLYLIVSFGRGGWLTTSLTRAPEITREMTVNFRRTFSSSLVVNLDIRRSYL